MQKEIKEVLKISEIADERGFSVSFEDFPLKHFHIVSIEPGAERGNHVHKYNEVICVIGGKNLAQITLEDSQRRCKFVIDKECKAITIPSGVKHIVKNVGDKVFFLICFSTESLSTPLISVLS